LDLYCASGIDPNRLSALSAQERALGLIDAFSGGAFSQASILASAHAYISASIFMQLMTILIPQMQKCRRKAPADKRRSTNGPPYLTVIVTFVQAYAYVTYLKSLGKTPSSIVSTLISG